MSRCIALATSAAFALLAGAVTSGVPQESGRSEPDGGAAAKQSRLRSVVAELSARDVAELSVAKRAARERCLQLLSDYAERAHFTVHHEEWPRELPLFIDEHGTRCALASVLDGIGEQAVSQRLARECNDAYLAEITDDPDLPRCLDELGITLDEAAYIQGPGHFAGPPPPPTPADLAARTVRRANSGSSARGSTTPPGTPGLPTGPTTGGGRGPTTLSRRNHDDPGAIRWPDWWLANRDTFVHLRGRYHDGHAATPTDAGRPNRPTAVEIRDELLPFFATLARDDADLRASALSEWSRAATAADAVAVRTAVLAFLADPNQREREWGPVMFAMLGDSSCCAPLAELLRDSDTGRRLLAQSAAVPERVRALAAIAFGRCGGPIDVLEEVLGDEPAAHPDVAAACVVAIGLSARDPARRAAGVSWLVGQLGTPTLPTSALAQVPAALVLTTDKAALPAICAVVEHFRGPRELRRGCALALGRVAPEFDEQVHDALAAVARRDVDADARHAAIVALGMLATRCGATMSPAVIQKLVTFQEDALDGRFRQAADLPWHALAAGMFVRARPGDADGVLVRLRATAAGAADLNARAAACLALGLAGDQAAQPILVDALENGSDFVASYAAQALGLAAVSSARPRLMELCLSSPSEAVSYGAAFALGCLADPTMVATIVSAFEQTPSASVRAALARALGEIGDRRAIDGLLRFAVDQQRDDPAREQALAALGVLGQAGDVAWNSPIREALNPGVATPSLELVLALF